MKSSILDALLSSPMLPEIVREAEIAFALETKRREQFYADITPEHKWEFIQGEVIMHSPALNRHLAASQHCYDLLSAYVRVNRLGLVRHEKAMTSFPRNDYEPDVMFFGVAKSQLITPDTLRFPIPDMIVEVLSPSTESRDRGVKCLDYALHGVEEYWVVDPVAETVEFFRLHGQEYKPAEKQTDGTLSSAVIPGFTIPVRAIFDEGANLEALKEILSGVS